MAKDPEKSQNPQKEFRDTDETHVNEIHQRIVAREQLEPEEGFESPPWWVWTVSVVLLFVMGFYLGRYGGSWGTISHEVEQPQAAGAATIKKEVKGDLVFVGVCQTCHQANGTGVPGQYPPLVGSEWALRDAETPIRIVLYGLEGPITVKGSMFNNKMPPFHDKLTDEEIAAVVSYIRSAWKNNAPAIQAAEVEAIRSSLGVRPPWRATELISLRTAKQP